VGVGLLGLWRMGTGGGEVSEVEVSKIEVSEVEVSEVEGLNACQLWGCTHSQMEQVAELLIGRKQQGKGTARMRWV